MAKYHISKETNRPNLCKARIRACPLGEHEPHFDSKDEARLYIEDENKKSFDEFATVSKIADTKNTQVETSKLKGSLSEKLSQAEFYEQYSAANPGYFKADYETSELAAKVVQAIELTEFSQQDFTAEPESKMAEVSSIVKRIPLTRGEGAYFKSLPANYEELTSVDSYGATNLKMMLNEVRAHNVAKALGFNELVPETVIAPVGPEDFGSLQKEVISTSSKIEVVSPGELKKASMFDFITGAQDRHDDNFIISHDGEQYRLNLIDNSYSFPSENTVFHYNISMFVGLHESDHFDYPAITLTPEDTEKLTSVRDSEAFKKLSDQFTESEFNGVRKRMDFLIENRVVPSWENYFESQEDPDYNIREELDLP